MDEKQKKTRKKEKKLSLLYVLGGGILKEDFIVKFQVRKYNFQKSVFQRRIRTLKELTGVK